MPSRPTPVDPIKGYPVQPGIHQTVPSDPDIYPIQPGTHVYRPVLNDAGQETRDENQSLIIPEVERRDPTVTDSKIRQLQSDENAESSSPATAAPSGTVVTVLPISNGDRTLETV